MPGRKLELAPLRRAQAFTDGPASRLGYLSTVAQVIPVRPRSLLSRWLMPIRMCTSLVDRAWRSLGTKLPHRLKRSGRGCLEIDECLRREGQRGSGECSFGCSLVVL